MNVRLRDHVTKPFQKHIDTLRREHQIDGVIVNGENSADGKGITSKIVNSLQQDKYL